MLKTHKSFLKLFWATVLCGFLGVFLITQTAWSFENPEKLCVWQAPQEGTPVHHYIVQVRINGTQLVDHSPVMSEQIVLSMNYGDNYSFRVAAVDSNGIQGEYSVWAKPYTPELAPPQF